MIHIPINMQIDTFGRAGILPLIKFYSQAQDAASQVMIQPEPVKVQREFVTIRYDGFSRLTGCYQVFSQTGWKIITDYWVDITQLSSFLS